MHLIYFIVKSKTIDSDKKLGSHRDSYVLKEYSARTAVSRDRSVRAVDASARGRDANPRPERSLSPTRALGQYRADPAALK